MSVLIVSMPGDAHALSVKWALEQKGTPASLLCWTDYPQRYAGSFRVGAGADAGLSMTGLQGADSVPVGISTIWNHRTTRPSPHPEIDAADHPAIVSSGEWFQRGAIAQLERDVFAANPMRAKWFFDNKLNQLQAAQACGFLLPDTLISNDFDEVSAFLRRHGGGIVKPLRFMKWNAGDHDVSLYTTAIDSLDQIDPVSVAACPMIYQEKVEKLCEYRVMVMGEEIVTFRLDSQADAEASLDWRILNYRKLPVALDQLPQSINDTILRFMRHCGFVTGSLDFALRPDGEIVLFELNETGQFLWLEEQCPEAPLLDMFSAFLQAGRADFRYRPEPAAVRFADWMKDMRSHFAADQPKHVTVNLDMRYPDSVPAQVA